MSSLFLEASKRSLVEGARERISTTQGWSGLALRTTVEHPNDSRPQYPRVSLAPTLRTHAEIFFPTAHPMHVLTPPPENHREVLPQSREACG